MTPIPDAQAAPVPPKESPGIAEKYRWMVYALCNKRLRGGLTDDEWDEEIRKLEQMK